MFDFDHCHHCASKRLAWIGYSPRALRRMRPAKDVHQCLDCGKTWYYSNTGRRPIKKFTKEE